MLATTPRTGTLTLSEGGNTLATVNVATATPNTSGFYALTVPGGLSFGSQTLTVSYSGDGIYAPSSTNATLNVTNESLKLQYTSQALANNAYAVSVAIVPQTPPATSGSPTAAAATTPPTPTGSLTLMQGTTVLATIPDLTQVTPNSAGYYTLTDTAGFPLGLQRLTISYSGDTNYSSNSASLAVTAVASLPTSVYDSYSTSAYVGMPYTVNATIYGTVALGTPRTGTLTLEDANGNTLAGPVDISTATPNANGSFALTVPGGLPLGANTGLQVVYSGDTNYASSSQILQTVTVKLIPDSISLSYSTPQSNLPLTINARINGTVLAGTPRTGTLTLSEGQTQLAQVDISTVTPNASGYYALSVPGGLSFGSQTLTVSYSGDNTYAASSTNATLNITNESLKLQYNSQALLNDPYAVNVAIVPQILPAPAGDTATAAAVTTPATPTGSLTLSEGSTVLATIPDMTQVTPTSAGYYTLTDTAGFALDLRV